MHVFALMLRHMVQDVLQETVSGIDKPANSIILYIRPQITATHMVPVLKLQWQTPQVNKRPA